MTSRVRVWLGALVVAGVLLLPGLAGGAPARGDDGGWLWATGVGGTGQVTGMRVAPGPGGSTIVAGNFSGEVAFGSRPALVSAGSSDVFAARLEASGAWAWAAQAGGPELDMLGGLAVLPDGAVMVAGLFGESAVFGSLPPLLSAGKEDVFLARLDGEGTWVWAIRAGGPEDDHGYGLALLPDGTVAVTGLFEDTAGFGDAGTVVSAGASDVFVAWATPDGAWTRVVRGGSTGPDEGRALVAVGDGLVLAGSIGEEATFGSLPPVPFQGGLLDALVARLDGDGGWTWATGGGGAGSDYLLGVAAWPDGGVAVSGVFEETAQFGSRPALVSAGGPDILVAVLDPGGAWRWTQRGGGALWDAGPGVVALPDGRVLVAGMFQQTATFPGVPDQVSAGQADILVGVLGADGQWTRVIAAGGAQSDEAYGVAPGGPGAILVTGTFRGTASFGTLPPLVAVGEWDMFVAVLPWGWWVQAEPVVFRAWAGGW